MLPPEEKTTKKTFSWKGTGLKNKKSCQISSEVTLKAIYYTHISNTVPKTYCLVRKQNVDLS